MNKPTTEKEVKQFKQDYQALSIEELITKHGKKLDTIRHWASELGIVRLKKITDKPEKEEEMEEPKVIYKPYPDFQIPPFPSTIGRRDKEDMGLILTDHHAARKTESYDTKIYIARNECLTGRAIRVVELHRPIGTLHVFMLGDMVQGEDVHKGANVDETECGVWTQINDIAVPTLSRLLLTLAQGVEEVEVWCVWGNHGRYSKEATRLANWDNFVYKGLEIALMNQKNITVHCPTEFYQLVNILGWKFFLFHGDQARSNQGIPLFALRRKLQDWYAYVKGFDYGYCGHWHSWGGDQVNSRADYQICPPLVTGDGWALEKVGRASMPVQLTFGVHSRRGRTWEYKLLTDPKFSMYQGNEDTV